MGEFPISIVSGACECAPTHPSVGIARPKDPQPVFLQVLSLQKKLSVTEAEARLREQDLNQTLAESHGKEKKLKDDIHNLEVKFQEASRTSESLQLGLSTCEGRAHGLEIELTKAEAARREVELKLVALHSVLRRTLGLGSRSPSPQRTYSPIKGQKISHHSYC